MTAEEQAYLDRAIAARRKGGASPGAPPADNDPRFREIAAKRSRGEKITEDERDYIETRMERRNQEESAKRNAPYAKAHPPRESTGLPGC